MSRLAFSPRTLLPMLGLVCLLAGVNPAPAADHQDAPALENSAAVGDQDINDTYIYQSPTNSANVVIIMTTNPFAGVMSPAQFGNDVTYQLQLDNNGDSLPDIDLTMRFFNLFGTQIGVVYMRDDSTLLGALGIPLPIAFTTTGRTGSTLVGGQFVFDMYDDPFFFDLNGFENGFQFTGDDFFAGGNVLAMVFEIPRSAIQGDDSNVGLIGRTLVNGFFDGDQVDRMGRPAINTVLIPTDTKNMYNRTPTSEDLFRYTDEVIDTLVNVLGRSQEDAEDLAELLLPDLLTVDLSSRAGFLNGRQLPNDVIDAELNLLSGGAVTTDGVDSNDRTFRNAFPFLATSNNTGAGGGGGDDDDDDDDGPSRPNRPNLRR